MRHVIAAFMLLWTIGVAAGEPPRNIDEDIRALRLAAAPGFCCEVDDYLQYSPAAAMLIMKACGYEGRTRWGGMLSADAFSVAIMAGVTQGLKYAINRPRPDNGPRSFPSGHTATAFLTATMLHKEYGWRSPWWSIGGYTVAAFTGISRILNDRHWMSDVAAGAAIGIGSVHLGYYLSDLIFRSRHLNPAYEKPSFSYNPQEKHYVAEFYFARRFALGGRQDPFGDGTIIRGGSAGLSTDIPIIPGIGATARLGANSLTYSTGLSGLTYSALAGGYYNFHFLKRLEVQARVLAGPVWMSRRTLGASLSPDTRGLGAEICLGAGLGIMLEENFKIRIFSDYDATCSSGGKCLHSILTGWSAAWIW